MQATSARFQPMLRHSHTVVVRATIYRPGNPTGVDARVTGGSLRADRDARVRRQGTLSVAFDLAGAADFVRELPFGGYAKAERGVMYGDGTTEYVPVGYLRVDAVTWESEKGEATLTLVDRMAQVQDEAFTTPWSPVGLKPTQAVEQAIRDVFGDTIGYHLETDPAQETALVDAIYDEDRAAAVGALASSIGAEAFFDARGDFVLAPAPDLEELEPAWTIDAGEEGALEIVSESLDRTSVRNGVAVRGQAGGDLPPIFALATDDDPESPTRWGGPFGKVALISNLTSVVTQEQADATAASLLRLRLGLARTLTLGALPNPALEPGDAVRIVFADGREEEQLVNAVEIPLDVEASLAVTTSSHWRPGVLGGATVRVYAGDAAWRELADAELHEEQAA